MSNSTKDDCSKKTCQSGIGEKPCIDDPNAEVYDRPLLYAGVLWIGVVKNILLPSSCHRSSSTSLLPASDNDHPPVDVSHSHAPPVTAADDGDQGGDRERHRPAARHTPTNKSGITERGTLGTSSGYSGLPDLVRDMQQQMRRLSDEMSLVLVDGRNIAAEELDRLRSEGNTEARHGAIAGSGLVGFMAGLRRGRGARLVYAASGALAAATLCYPREALELGMAAMELLENAALSGVTSVREGFLKTPPLDDPNHYSDAKRIELNVRPTTVDHETRQTQPKKCDGGETNRLPQKPYSPDPRQSESSHLAASLPYSPALPAPPPPKTTWDWDARVESHVPLPPVQDAKDSSGVMEKFFSDGEVEVYIRVVTETDQESEGGEKERERREDTSTEKTTTEEDRTSNHYPLNKKLSRYYQQKEQDEPISYLDKGNEDLYSKGR